jgi:hypothetical protein
MVAMVEENEGLSRVHPGNGGIALVGVAHDVGNGSVKRLAVLALLFELPSVLVEQAVRVIKACLLEAEVISTVRETIHVLGIHGEVHTDGVTADNGSSLLGSVLLALIHRLVDNSVVNWLVNNGGMSGKILSLIEKIIVVINDDSLVAVNVLNDSEWVELNLVRNLILTADQDTIIEDLNEIRKVLLNLDLIPRDTDTSVRDREALFLIGSLDLDLHDTLLEESHVKVEVGSTELVVIESVSAEVLVIVKVKTADNGILMDDHAVWLDEIASHEMVILNAVRCVPLLAIVLLVVSSELAVVTAEHVAEARAVGALAAAAFPLFGPFLFGMSVAHSLAFIRMEIMVERVVFLMLGLSVVHEALLVSGLVVVGLSGLPSASLSWLLMDVVLLAVILVRRAGSVERVARMNWALFVSLLVGLVVVVIRCSVDGVVMGSSVYGRVMGSSVVGSRSVVDRVLGLVQDCLQRHAVGVKGLLGGVSSVSKQA